MLLIVGAAAAALGTYGYWDVNHRPDRPDDAVYVAFGTVTYYALWAAGAVALGWGAWLLGTDGADAPAQRQLAH